MPLEVSGMFQNRCAFCNIAVFVFFCILLTAHSVMADIKKGENRRTDIRDAMVKIYTVASEPYYYSPWKIGNPRNSTGSGSVISGKRILTNAHVVSNQKYIQVQFYGQSRRHNARVLYVSHEADLALLTVDDKNVFSDIESLELGSLPETLQEVLVYGFPTGGDSLSITKGILSRVEYQEYVHSSYNFLAGQIDAAINPGNSGGPVIVNDKFIGVAMQKINSGDTENIGYMVPAPVILHFLMDIEDGQYDGFPEIGFITQNMENPSLKQKYNMTKAQTGVLVTHVYWNSSAQGNIQEGDVILSIDGNRIADNGTIEFRPKERIPYLYYSHMHHVRDTVHLSILRNGNTRNISYQLNQTGNDFRLVAPIQYDINPRYFIFAGVVFSPLTENLICGWKNCNAPNELIVAKNDKPSKTRREVVVAVQVLPDDINKGYHDMQTWIVKEVNGKGFRDFNEFYQMVTASTEPFMVFKTDKENQIVIDRKKADQSHRKILQTYNIKEDHSPDIQQVLTENYLMYSKRH